MNNYLSLPVLGAWKKFHTKHIPQVRLRSYATLWLLFLGMSSMLAQITWLDMNKQTAPDRQAFDGFGYSVSMAQTFALVGAPFADVEIDGNLFAEAGKVYLYQLSGTTWTYSQTILPPNPQVNGNFGYSVSAFQDRAAVGQPNPIGIGSAYIFWVNGGNYNYC